jgi:hypothetical protein
VRKTEISISTVGIDECDTAAVIFDCANKKNPDVVIDMISNAVINPAAVIIESISHYNYQQISHKNRNPVP